MSRALPSLVTLGASPPKQPRRNSAPPAPTSPALAALVLWQYKLDSLIVAWQQGELTSERVLAWWESQVDDASHGSLDAMGAVLLLVGAFGGDRDDVVRQLLRRNDIESPCIDVIVQAIPAAVLALHSLFEGSAAPSVMLSVTPSAMPSVVLWRGTYDTEDAPKAVAASYERRFTSWTTNVGVALKHRGTLRRPQEPCCLFRMRVEDTSAARRLVRVNAILPHELNVFPGEDEWLLRPGPLKVEGATRALAHELLPAAAFMGREYARQGSEVTLVDVTLV